MRRLLQLYLRYFESYLRFMIINLQSSGVGTSLSGSSTVEITKKGYPRWVCNITKIKSIGKF